MHDRGEEKSGALALAFHGFVALVWFGMVCGVSFLATPVKFEADGLSLPVALDVGNVTFALFSKVEWALLVLLMTGSVFLFRRRGLMAATGLLVAIVLAQSFWLLPVLDARVAAVIAGDPLPGSMHHFLYAGGEALKALILAGVGLFALAARARRQG